ncbi:hypothetical protein RDWZM_009479 [Blomia tropicalis]|uniref:Hexosyltransferase n=1 Tax=Blomia tropicalis TaxID=40697 RepID=A0A9Q0M5C4_BLOTA|nr:hypothetical protein RDWZM_009479 [Blomia tropicalis]
MVTFTISTIDNMGKSIILPKENLDELIPLKMENFDHFRTTWTQYLGEIKSTVRNKSIEQFSFKQVANRSVKNCLKNKKNKNKSLNLVILIHSAIENFQQRNLLRNTWLQLDQISNRNVNIVHAFILGDRQSSKLNQKVKSEANLYGDIVQANFIDSYSNLTYKHLSSLRWAIDFTCPTEAIDFIFKVDDDAFVDLQAIIKYLQLIRHKRHQSMIACSLFPDGTKPKRHGKWSLSYSLYPFETFPSYCSGVAYFMTPHLAKKLVQTSTKLPEDFPIIPIDDVFVTGMMRTIIEPMEKPIAINERFVYDANLLRTWLDDKRRCPMGYLVGDIGSEPDRIRLTYQLWNATQNAWKRKRMGKCIEITKQVAKSSL